MSRAGIARSERGWGHLPDGKGLGPLSPTCPANPDGKGLGPLSPTCPANPDGKGLGPLSPNQSGDAQPDRAVATRGRPDQQCLSRRGDGRVLARGAPAEGAPGRAGARDRSRPSPVHPPGDTPQGAPRCARRSCIVRNRTNPSATPGPGWTMSCRTCPRPATPCMSGRHGCRTNPSLVGIGGAAVSCSQGAAPRPRSNEPDGLKQL
jgi:hypothetical protein